MKRTAAAMTTVVVVTAGAYLYLSAPGCVRSFQIRYTSGLAAFVARTSDNNVGRLCEYIVAELLQLDVVAAALGREANDIANRLRIEALGSGALQHECRFEYRGLDAMETQHVLRVLARIVAKKTERIALDQRAQSQKLVRRYLAESAERRANAESADGGTTEEDRKWALSGDVENWSEDELEKVVTKLNSVLEEPAKAQTASACVELADRLDGGSATQVRELEARCRNAKPIGITAWPTLAVTCPPMS